MVQDIITWIIVAAAVVWIVKRIYDRTHNGGCDCGCGCDGCNARNTDCQGCLQNGNQKDS